MDQAASFARRFLGQEAEGLLHRLARLKAFSLGFPMLPAANIPGKAALAIERLLSRERHGLRLEIEAFLSWLGSNGSAPSSSEAQRRFTALKLHFNAVVSQVDIFVDVLSQRGEHEMGTFVAGLDEVAADALDLGTRAFQAPPLVCFLDRGHGAAIRRARTRLPGGASNPVAVIRVPRERMVGSGIAGSLVHEVGHQGAALLDLVTSLRAAITARAATTPHLGWRYWHRCISEMVADLWAVARVGVAATVGLMAVVSLPRPFVFRLDLDDPHPAPWLRVKLSAAVGAALFPHAQWAHLQAAWERLYPIGGAAAAVRGNLQALAAHIEAIVALMLEHRPATLAGARLGDVLRSPDCAPANLARTFSLFRADPGALTRVRPCVSFAALAQAKLEGRLSGAEESALLGRLLTRWGLTALLRGLGRQIPYPGAAPALTAIPGDRAQIPTLTGRGGTHVRQAN